MQFKHPEILYAFFLLIIPIIIHLFQFKKFKKTPFTNVAFLQKIELQTRKSSRLKKWLILLTRMLAFTCLILAFSQPYFSKYKNSKNNEIAIYLDNSFSMQAKNTEGELYQAALQNLIEHANNATYKTTIFTNTNSFKNDNIQELKNNLIDSKLTHKKLDITTALLKLKNLQHKNKTSKNILISDFQQINFNQNINLKKINIPTFFIQKTPTTSNNCYVDSIYLSSKNGLEKELTAVVKTIEKCTQNISISFFNGKNLLGKSTAKFNNSNKSNVYFRLPKNKSISGKISINDAVLPFDNNLYYATNTPAKINVISIGKVASFLQKIYTKDEFNYVHFNENNIDYSLIPKQQVIIINEVTKISNTLKKELITFSKNGGTLVIIPSKNINIENYNSFLLNFTSGSISKKITSEQKITKINFRHPIFSTVFERNVQNFQYPKVTTYYVNNLIQHKIIGFENGKSFIGSLSKNVYWCAGSINTTNSNLTKSPLIVPLFYNFAKFSLQNNTLYYTISPNTLVDIPIKIAKDEILTIKKIEEDTELIPIQQVFSNKVQLSFNNLNLTQGLYKVYHRKNPIKTIAFNYSREESNLTYINLTNALKNQKQVTVATNLAEVLQDLENDLKINWLFKWFLIFSILFLLAELWILKFLKV